MLKIKASVKQSALEGIGLFADEKIPKGATIWQFDPLVDLRFEPTEVAKMSAHHQELIIRYAVLSMVSGQYVFSIDNARFINHSATHPNMLSVPSPGEPETRAVAARDIEPGEELLIDYRSIDTADAKSDQAYLNQ